MYSILYKNDKILLFGYNAYRRWIYDKKGKIFKKIRPFYDKDLIKIITGIRRSSKSVILTQIMDGLKDKGIKDEQIIYVNFEYIDHIDITNAKALNNYIENKLITKNNSINKRLILPIIIAEKTVSIISHINTIANL